MRMRAANQFCKYETVAYNSVVGGISVIALAAWALGDLLAPIQVSAGGSPINVDAGHAAPLLFDFDEDGKRDLLVGQYGEGKLRIYKNVGNDKAPSFKDFTYFEAGGKIASVPYG